MHKKKCDRIKRAKYTRKKLIQLKAIRLVVHRTSRHIYAQIIDSQNSKILVAASTTEKIIKNHLKYLGNKQSATFIGQKIAERSLQRNIKKVSFDRSGFKYHGRVQELANAARKFGLQF